METHFIEMLLSAVRQPFLALKRRTFNPGLRMDFYRTMYLEQSGKTAKIDALRSIRDTYDVHLPVWQKFINDVWQKRLGFPRPLFRSVMAQVAEDGLFQAGLPLSLALIKWLPPAERAILFAGESAGSLVQSYELARTHLMRQSNMWAAVYAAFAYPLFLFLAALGVMYQFEEELFSRVNRKTIFFSSRLQQFAADACHWVHDYWFLFAAAAFGMTALIFWSLANWTGRLRTLADRWVPYSLYRLVHGALFISTFSILQRAGISVPQALGTLSSYATPYLRERIAAAGVGVRQGYNIGRALRLAGHDFPDWKALPTMESIASKSKGPEALFAYANEWLDDTAKRVQKYAKMAFFISLILMTGWIALLASTLMQVMGAGFS